MENKKSKQLLFSITKKDLKISYFSGKGAGGQHRNKHQNCVRIIHPASGAMVVGQNQRSRKQNMNTAIKNLIEHPKFKVWLSHKIWLDETEMEAEIEKALQPKNLKVEVFVNGRWVTKKGDVS